VNSVSMRSPHLPLPRGERAGVRVKPVKQSPLALTLSRKGRGNMTLDRRLILTSVSLAFRGRFSLGAIAAGQKGANVVAAGLFIPFVVGPPPALVERLGGRPLEDQAIAAAADQILPAGSLERSAHFE